MNTLTKQQLSDGGNVPPSEQIKLHAGPVSALYENGTLRYIKLGQTEVVRQVYSAVRDHNWGTIAGKLSDVVMDIQSDHFAIQYRSTHQQNDIDFVWDATLTGNTDGTIVFKMEGEARSTFKRNRIGFCVLHPMECAGSSCVVQHVNGKETAGQFPHSISPHQPFFDIRAITHDVSPGVKVRVLMEGDTFEMEDQRNWTDASFKTYCTPLGLPFPVTIEAGTKIAQTITIQPEGDIPKVVVKQDERTITLGKETSKLPHIGLCVSGNRQPLTAKEVERLAALHLNHLRVDLRLWQADVRSNLQSATAQAYAIHANLEIAVHVSKNAVDELQSLRELLDTINPPLSRWLIFHQNEKSTTAQWVELARQYLGNYGKTIPIGAGTDAFFTELNRERPPVAAADTLTFSNNPQVHAFDNASLTETLAAQATTVKSARQFCDNKPVCVSPVTLKMRWNPNATGPAPVIPEGELPPQVDARQLSLFGAGWTLGSIKNLAEGGADSITYYETTGWLGIMATVEGSPLPDKFPAIPGSVYPMYHVFADVGEFAGGETLNCTSNDSLTVAALALKKGDRLCVLIANFTGEEQAVSLNGFAGRWHWRSLDTDTALDAMQTPEAYRQQNSNLLQQYSLTLKPYAIIRLDHKGS